MSGVEAVAFTLGVVPILIEAVKVYRSTADKIHTFRHYSREVDRIQRKFQTQKQFFLNECHQLLRLILNNDQKAKEMVENSTHDLWEDEELEEQLNNYLSGNYQACHNILEDTGGSLKEFEQELKCFDILRTRRTKGEKLKDTIRRVRRSIQIGFEKSKFENIVVSLRDSNTDLCQLRSYLGDFQQQHLHPSNQCLTRRSLPPQYNEIQETSQRLHEALFREWCCGDASHTAHTAKLFLDAQVNDDVRLDIALSFYRKDLQRSMTAERPIWICVESKNIATGLSDGHIPNSPSTPSVIAAVNKTIREQQSKLLGIKSVTTKRIDSQPSQGCTDRAKKKRKVHFSDEGARYDVVENQQHEQSVTAACLQFPLLQEVKLCQTLSAPRPANCCICYLETPNLFRHIFYAAESRRCDRPDSLINTIALPDLVRRTAEETLDPLQSLKLAHKLATAVLQYHSTPWLNQEWRLQDVSFFGAQIESADDVLPTLHFSSRISEHDSDPAFLRMDGVERTTYVSAPSDADETKLLYGINNMTLFSLGVALLELGHWKFLESDVILNARRLATRRAPLGPKYQDIVLKCLQCNFGFGTDLNRRELQNAVYSDVVCQLEKMIEALDICGD
ncbi:MAG: hypothetical protein M1816_000597 [Peltula sp. TS41687]|nr:MAG: hypothetical protein M1816_000597 [Peltula sp. TS41687]